MIDLIIEAKEEAIGDFDFSDIEGWQSKAEQLSFPGWGLYDKPGLPSGYPGTTGSLNKQIATGPDPYLPGLEPINTMMNPVWNNQTQAFEYPMKAAEGGRVGYDEGIGPVGSLAMNKENVPQMFVSDEAGALPKMDGGVLPDDLGNLNIDDFENIEDYMRYLRMVNQNNQGGRVGLYAGGDPDDYPEKEEDDVTPWQLQQEEGVPIGPMAGGTPEHFETLFKMYIGMGLTPNEAYSKVIEIYASMRKDEAQGGRVGAFGGGVMGIGTPGMRLPGIPQMAPDGLEYNMKAGGFQNLGAQEGKDDVNAKLAKNEFVMTADAVRGAGGGSVEKGAQRMYDTMKQLEGKVV